MRKRNRNPKETPVMVLTNERTEFKGNQILMFYKAAELGQLAYMDGLDPETGDIVPLLVGLEPTKDKTQFKVYPLAKLISKYGEIKEYMVPDGQGGWFTDKPAGESLASAEEEGPATPGRESTH